MCEVHATIVRRGGAGGNRSRCRRGADRSGSRGAGNRWDSTRRGAPTLVSPDTPPPGVENHRLLRQSRLVVAEDLVGIPRIPVGKIGHEGVDSGLLNRPSGGGVLPPQGGIFPTGHRKEVWRLASFSVTVRGDDPRPGGRGTRDSKGTSP